MVETELNNMPAKLKLVKKSECYRLTWIGRVLVLLFFTAFLFFLALFIPKFLSQSNPVNGQILVLDGLMPDYAIKAAIDLYESGNYEQVVVTGEILSVGYAIADIKTMAGLSYATFIELGFEADNITSLPTGNVVRNRTFTSALKLNSWIKDNKLNITKIDVLAVGCHAARSKYLFDRALDEHIAVGVVAVEDMGYNGKRWWQTSRGLRTVLSEGLGYLYVRFFFFPRKH